MIRKRARAQARGIAFAEALVEVSGASEVGLSRRRFLRASGLTAFGGLAGIGLGATGRVVAQVPGQAAVSSETKRIKTICPFCSVGCSIWAEVQNGVWTGQEPVFESPINMGTHCAKGAATRELAHGERRLKYPMKLAGGRWTRISWEQAVDEIGEIGRAHV